MRFTQYIRGDLRMRGMAGVTFGLENFGLDDGYANIINHIKRFGSLDVAEDLVPDASDDSWQGFYRHSPALAEGNVGGPSASALLQEQWERDQRARQLLKQQTSDKEWEDEETKRAKAEARAKARVEAAERRRKRDEEYRRQAEALREQYAEQQRAKRAEWVAAVEAAITECRDTRYEPLIQELQAAIEMANDFHQLDAVRFRAIFENQKRIVDAQLHAHAG